MSAARPDLPVPATFTALLERRLRAQPGAPLVTFYDDATGERTELSVTSCANWVSKHANLWREELELDDGATVLVDLPAHWLVPVLVGGAWSAGLGVTTDAAVAHDAVVTDVAGAARHAERLGPQLGVVPVLACALHPFALPSPDPLPAGVLDHGHLWPGQSDVHVPLVPLTGDEDAWSDADGTASVRELIGVAAAAGTPGRLLTTEHPATGRGVPDLLVPLLLGSVVYVAHPGPDFWSGEVEDRAAQEGVDRWRGQPDR